MQAWFFLPVPSRMHAAIRARNGSANFGGGSSPRLSGSGWPPRLCGGLGKPAACLGQIPLEKPASGSQQTCTFISERHVWPSVRARRLPTMGSTIQSRLPPCLLCRQIIILAITALVVFHRELTAHQGSKGPTKRNEP